ncbi:PA0069 family radical SAM protein [Hydrogenophaga atypica]|uniref:PA0069 family radical SAM protein n=1 Tax=Hydrogenophaga atypica TaxID=249409 RepID=A0ABW2QT02_9BURK
MSDVRIPVHAIKGRGAASRLAHRFSVDERAGFDDGWGTLDEAGAAAQGIPATQVTDELARSAISRNTSPDVPFTQSINPYRGCEHGCIYCYARPTHSYLNLSPGLDFETKIIAKRNIAQRLRHDLGKPGHLPEPIGLGTVTDAYQPVERELRLTRSVLEVLQEAQHPLAIITKSSGVERDLDVLAPMAAQRLASVYVTITTLDAALARTLEPRAAAPHRRLRTIRTLVDAGIPVGVSVSPQIPFINEDMEQVLAAARDAGADRAFYQVVRLPWEVAPLFREWLQVHHPLRADRVMARIQDMRGGKDYTADFATRMRGQGIWADLIHQRFEKACRRLGLNRERHSLDGSRFRPPGVAGQMPLF